MRHAVIGTAGHVDHGKTALVFALTEVQTDRLPEEQRRGITIELGFAPWRVRDDLLISIIDAPGHRRLVHTMIAGASGIDLVLLVVAADEGVMPQTREHVAACELLGVERAVVAVTKVDRADHELAELAGEEALELLAEHNIEAQVVVCSAKTGEGVEAVRATVLEAIDATSSSRRDSKRVRLSVDRAFTVHGSGTVVTGTLVQGALQSGGPLRVLAANRDESTVARALHVHGETKNVAEAPTRLAINLAGLTLEQVRRGDVITNDSHVKPTRVLDVWLRTNEHIKRGAEASIFIGTARSIAKIQPLAEGATDQGVFARLRLTTPLVAFGGDRYVLRGAKVDGPAGAVFGGGVVLDAHPPRTVRAAKRAALLQALHDKDADAVIAALALERSPYPVGREELPSRFALSATQLEEAAATACGLETLVATRDGGWLAAAALATLKDKALALVGAHHDSAPLDPGLRLQTLRERLTSFAGEAACALVIERLTTGESAALLAEGNVVKLPNFTGVEGDSKAAQELAEATAFVVEAGLQGVSENAMMQRFDTDVKKTRALLAAMERKNSAVHCASLWFDAGAIETLIGRVGAHFDTQDKLSIADFKTITGLGRKQSIPLLEHLDRQRITKRERDGSDRIKG